MVLSAAMLCAPAIVAAIDQAGLTLENISNETLRAEGIAIQLSLAGGGPGAILQIAHLEHRALKQPLRNIRVTCPGFVLEPTRIRCGRATIAGEFPILGSTRFEAVVTYELASGTLNLDIEDLPLGSGSVDSSIHLQGDHWEIAAQLERVPLGPLLQLAALTTIDLPAFMATGTISGDFKALGSGGAPDAIEFTTRWDELTAGNEQGTLATDRLTAALQGRASPVEDNGIAGWAFTLRIDATAGQAYAEPVFLELARYPAILTLEGTALSDGAITLRAFNLDHRGVSRLHGSARLQLGVEPLVTQLDLDLEELVFPGAYASYLQPFLLDSSFKSLETAGRLTGQVRIAAGAPQSIDLTLQDFSADDGAERLAVYSLSGDVHWSQNSGAPAASNLSWEGGLLLGMDLGPARLAFATAARSFRLLEHTTLPLLDGAIELGRFAVTDAGRPEMAFVLDANIQPISVQRLSRAFGWPEFGGRLAGRITDLRLEAGVLSLATTLQAQVFDGRIDVSELRLEQPFGDWPRLYASIGVYNLDLEQVTSAFSFGLITGRLSGYVNELELFNWMPVGFDLRLYTPADDRSRHRISQRAVQNIGNLGGGGAGVAAALQGGIMSFFDEFNYDRLGISCRLENEVCLMDGVDPAPNGGYYLVKGRGLPRIDVIGNAARVDWPRLVAQLQAISASGGPVIQ